MNASDIRRAMDILCQRLHRNQSSGFHISPHLEKAVWHDTTKCGIPILCRPDHLIHDAKIEKKIKNVLFQIVDPYLWGGKLWLRYCDALHFKRHQEDKQFKIPGYYSSPATALLLAADHNLESLVTSAIDDLNLLNLVPDLIQKLLELGVPDDYQEYQSVMTYDTSLLENHEYANYGCW